MANHGCRRFGSMLLVLAGAMGLALPLAAKDDTRKADGAPAGEKKLGYGKPGAQTAAVIPPEWSSLPKERLTSSQLDALLRKEQMADQLKPSPRTTDEQFLRRVSLDLTGRPPTPAQIKSFVADTSSGKRIAVIDRLLASDDFNQHWARYWRDTVGARATDNRMRAQEPQFEAWLYEAIKSNQDWGSITRAIITAKGSVLTPQGPMAQDDDKDKVANANGASFLLLTSRGSEAINERAAEVSRLFLGIQIQCAQCHDHPSDIWKQKQFHEFAAFFARMRERPIRASTGNRLLGYEVVSLPRGEHQMTDTKDPSIRTPVQPKFITGEGVRPGLPDDARREALANFIVNPNNYWFPAAFVNRAWGQLMGQSFYQPVDNMGPLQEATYPGVLLQLAAHFQATGYDIRDLYRLIANSETYQRQIRIGESQDKHLHFAANYPARLRPDALWEQLNSALGGFAPPGRGRNADTRELRRTNPLAARFGFEGLFTQTFAFDPSTPPDAVEGTVTQALLLMNNPAIQARMRAAPQTVLGPILRDNPRDADAVEALYLKVLARRPTQRELRTSLDYLSQMRLRTEGYEDLLWALVNSAEFQTKR